MEGVGGDTASMEPVQQRANEAWRLYQYYLDKTTPHATNRYSVTKAFFIAFVMTFFSFFDIPVFWPILLCCWIVLFVLTMRHQIAHMMKYKYIPLSLGKQNRIMEGGRALALAAETLAQTEVYGHWCRSSFLSSLTYLH